MSKIIRYYNQNRIRVWIAILMILFIIIIIQVLNQIAKETKNAETKEKETASNVVSYRNESKSIISEGSVPKTQREKLGSLIDEFFTYCINHQPEKAYQLLAPDTLKTLYPTQKQFENLYYQERFEGNKKYSFQSWSRSAENIYVYQVKIFEDQLATGKTSDNQYIEDYVTIVPVGDIYQLNINRYIGKTTMYQKQSNDKIRIEITAVDTYLDYEIYTFQIKNNLDQTILLDTRRKTDTIYIKDEEGNKFESYLYENKEEDLQLKPQEAKTIQIKFNDRYLVNRKLKSIHFTDIIEQEAYQGNETIEPSTLIIDLK